MRGLAKNTVELIAFARQVLAEHHPMTLRQLHYAIFSAAKIAYDNTPQDYKRLSRATTKARRHYRALELERKPDTRAKHYCDDNEVDFLESDALESDRAHSTRLDRGRIARSRTSQPLG
jgi:hypothetical protein